ncbi:AbrB/MazE/SpoVT family DNA-binding domain-containing protein [Geotalea uraniireducens]|uniref:Transcriptional regulator, AbrB family n=1 Tax=Geotalea uraniireducens (strain Rf4) TaxID=351605 RepID=A5G781_GEOUR|nr:AbrB/MazE/SpoVT family DNA-binding domain-containing protein [Geotalea uraniireducens]ABQ27649.1 transcriptional regulator, AbrB family [Geotalea uraniireducens Rf4]
MLSTVTSKGQVTIPKEIRDLLHIRSNDKVDFVLDGDRVLLVPVKTLLDLRGAVRARGKGDFSEERARAKTAVAKRVREEMK